MNSPRELTAIESALAADVARLNKRVAELEAALRRLRDAGEAHMRTHPSEGLAEFAKSTAMFYSELSRTNAALKGAK